MLSSLLATMATCTPPNLLSVGLLHAGLLGVPIWKLTMPTPSAERLVVVVIGAPELTVTHGANSLPLPGSPNTGGPMFQITVGEWKLVLPYCVGSSASPPLVSTLMAAMVQISGCVG